MTTWNTCKFGLALILLCPLAFAQEDNAEEVDSEGAEARVCVSTRLIDGFDALTDEHIFIDARGNDYYLFTMKRRCIGLRSARGIAIKDPMNRVCSKGFAEVIYRDMGRDFQSCMIDTIEKVESKDAARELIKQREEEKD